MKNLCVIAAAALITLSCSSDDDGGNASVNGTWKLTKFQITEEVDFNNDGNATDDIRKETGCYDNSTIVFNPETETATFSIQQIDVQLEGTETDFDYVVECLPAEADVVAYEVSGNIVSLDTGEDITALTRSGNKLTFALAEFSQVPIEVDGEIVVVPVGAYFEFMKQ